MKYELVSQVLKLSIYRLNYLDFHFAYYHCNVTTALELQLLSSKIYHHKVCLKCENSVRPARLVSKNYFFANVCVCVCLHVCVHP